jgi:hypothetical protein
MVPRKWGSVDLIGVCTCTPTVKDCPTCPKGAKRAGAGAGAGAAVKKPRKAARACGFCRIPGHTRRKCPAMDDWNRVSVEGPQTLVLYPTSRRRAREDPRSRWALFERTVLIDGKVAKGADGGTPVYQAKHKLAAGRLWLALHRWGTRVSPFYRWEISDEWDRTRRSPQPQIWLRSTTSTTFESLMGNGKGDLLPHTFRTQWSGAFAHHRNSMSIQEWNPQEVLGTTAFNGDLQGVTVAANNGANVNAAVYKARVQGSMGGGVTAVYLAAREGRVKVLRFLVGTKKDRNLVQRLDPTFPAYLKVLTGTEADPNRTNRPDGAMPLHAACIFGRAECVRVLIAAGADPNRASTNGNGTTPCMLAAEFGHVACLRALAPQDTLVSVNAMCTGGKNRGKTALDIADGLRRFGAMYFLRRIGGFNRLNLNRQRNGGKRNKGKGNKQTREDIGFTTSFDYGDEGGSTLRNRWLYRQNSYNNRTRAPSSSNPEVDSLAKRLVSLRCV